MTRVARISGTEHPAVNGGDACRQRHFEDAIPAEAFAQRLQLDESILRG
jgi:hypothetical protein